MLNFKRNITKQTKARLRNWNKRQIYCQIEALKEMLVNRSIALTRTEKSQIQEIIRLEKNIISNWQKVPKE